MRSPGTKDTFPGAVRSPVPLLIPGQSHRQALGWPPSPHPSFQEVDIAGGSEERKDGPEVK